jgi:hypothetical protein
MLDTDEQLARLKRQIAVINQKFGNQPTKARQAPIATPPLTPHQTARWFIEEWSEGQVVENEFGQHFQTERLFASHKNHGSADIGALADLPHDLLEALGGGEIRTLPPHRWAFLDTETTGLAGGSGTYAFLIGVGRITGDGFAVRQFFMREYAEERSILAALEAHLNDFDVLITYNGKSYDQPLLETWASGSAAWRAQTVEAAAGNLPADATGRANPRRVPRGRFGGRTHSICVF